MPITVRDLLEVPGLGLSLVAGEAGLDHQIRWAHVSELQDPTPWLSGGEFLLTTGMGLKGSSTLQRAYVRRLAAAGLAGLGFGVGFDFDDVPEAIRRAADRQGFPVLEVPYPVPFIAISEAVFSRLVEDRLRDAQMSVEVHERLASLVLEDAGPGDVLAEAVGITGGWAYLFDAKGNVLATAGDGDRPEPDELWAGLPPGFHAGKAGTATETGPRGSHVALAVVAGKRLEGVLVVGKRGKLEQRDRIVVHHALTVLSLLLAARRAVMDAEWRVTGDILGEAFAGRLQGEELERRLERMGFPAAAPMTAIVVEVAPAVDAAVLQDVGWSVDLALGARLGPVRTTVVGDRVAAVVAAEADDATAHFVRDSLIHPDGESAVLVTGHIDPRVAVGQTVAPAGLQRSYLTALFALRAAPDKPVVTPRDLGSYALLLGEQPRAMLEAFVGSVLGELLQRDAMRSSQLVASVKAFVESGGRWEMGARALGVHRHTLRYRVRQAEEILGRDLSREEERLDVILALKGLEILEE